MQLALHSNHIFGMRFKHAFFNVLTNSLEVLTRLPRIVFVVPLIGKVSRSMVSNSNAMYKATVSFVNVLDSSMHLFKSQELSDQTVTDINRLIGYLTQEHSNIERFSKNRFVRLYVDTARVLATNEATISMLYDRLRIIKRVKQKPNKSVDSLAISAAYRSAHTLSAIYGN